MTFAPVQKHALPYFTLLGLTLFFTLSLTNFGLMFERHHFSVPMELTRLLVMLLAGLYLTPSPLTGALLTHHTPH